MTRFTNNEKRSFEKNKLIIVKNESHIDSSFLVPMCTDAEANISKHFAVIFIEIEFFFRFHNYFKVSTTTTRRISISLAYKCEQQARQNITCLLLYTVAQSYRHI